MSSLVQNNNALVFGSQNPFRNYLTEPGLKNTFLHLLLDKSSKIYKSKSWHVFCLANKIFPNKVAEINENVKFGISKVLDPFVGTNITIAENHIYQTPRQKYIQGEIDLTQALIKATGIKNTLVMIMDNDKECRSNCHGIITYLTRNTVNGSCEPIEAAWSNKFFTFNDAANLAMVIIIPRQYIASLIQNVLAVSTKELNSSFADKIVIKSNMIDEFTIDLIKSIFSAIYSDGIRSRVTSDILLANKLLQSEGMNITSTTDPSNYSEAIKASDVFQKHTQALHQFKRNSGDEHLVYEMLQFVNASSSSCKINPLEFYNSFIDTPYVHMENIFSRCGSFQRLSNQSITYANFNFSNNLNEMDGFYSDKDRDVIVYGLKILRYLPFMLFNTYIIGGGMSHNEAKQVITNIKRIMPSILGYKASNYWSSPIVTFIVENINYLTEKLAVELSSPLTVTTNTRIALIHAINKFGYVAEDPTEDDDSSLAKEVSDKPMV